MTDIRNRRRRALMLGLRLMLGAAGLAPAFALALVPAARADGWEHRGWGRGGWGRGGWGHHEWEHHGGGYGRWGYYGAPAVVVSPPVVVAPPPVVVAPPVMMVAPPVVVAPAGINVFIPFHLW